LLGTSYIDRRDERPIHTLLLELFTLKILLVVKKCKYKVLLLVFPQLLR